MLIQVIGWRGSGKTYWVVHLIKNIINSFKFPVWANFRIHVDNFYKFKLSDLLNLPHNFILVMDEGYSLIHSRLSMSYINIFSGFIAFQLRKTNTAIFITAQQLRTIDVIYREEWDYRVFCERIPNGSKQWKKFDFLFEIHNKRSGSISRWVVKYENAKEIFPLYDTYEIIKPRNESRIEYELISDDPYELSLASERKYNLIKNDLTTGTKDDIEFCLKRKHIDKCWKNDVFIEMKRDKNKI